jgi:hypothetical protein
MFLVPIRKLLFVNGRNTGRITDKTAQVFYHDGIRGLDHEKILCMARTAPNDNVEIRVVIPVIRDDPDFPAAPHMRVP